jgi:thiosulfate/3-mercaptopyruvate sulfurtransferase
MGFDHTHALISVRELATLLHTERPPVVLDVRWRLNTPSRLPDYEQSHIPGARWCDLETDLSDPPGVRGRHPLPDPQRLQHRFRDWGLHEDSCVVVYDIEDSLAAARAWWILRWAGLTDVHVLDGGWAAWERSGEEVTAEVPSAGGGTAAVRPGSVKTVEADAIPSLVATGVLVDVRAAERFAGETEPIDPVAGRIPGAVNVPTVANVDDNGLFLPAEALRRRFDAAGISAAASAGDPVAVYCGSGVTAAHTVLALQLVGIESALYPGSWSEWITDPNRPVATGA